MVFINLPQDIRIYFIKFFDIYMLQNYALTYKYGLESIQKYLYYRRLSNNDKNIKPTIDNSLIRLRKKYLGYGRLRYINYFNKPIIVKINKIVKICHINAKYKCYFIVINKPRLCGNKYYMYPDWHNFKTIEFDKEDYIPYI